MNTPRPSRGTRIESCGFIVLIGDPWFFLFYFAWPRVSSGSDGLYLSSLSDMSPATSDCLEPYFSVFCLLLFSNYRVCLTFLGPFISL